MKSGSLVFRFFNPLDRQWYISTLRWSEIKWENSFMIMINARGSQGKKSSKISFCEKWPSIRSMKRHDVCWMCKLHSASSFLADLWLLFHALLLSSPESETKHQFNYVEKNEQENQANVVSLFNATFFLSFSFIPGSPSSMPHMHYEKSKMIDITRDKPIKIAVRVAVPVRDHPKVKHKKRWKGCDRIVMFLKLWFAV